MCRVGGAVHAFIAVHCSLACADPFRFGERFRACFCTSYGDVCSSVTGSSEEVYASGVEHHPCVGSVLGWWSRLGKRRGPGFSDYVRVCWGFVSIWLREETLAVGDDIGGDCELVQAESLAVRDDIGGDCALVRAYAIAVCDNIGDDGARLRVYVTCVILLPRGVGKAALDRSVSLMGDGLDGAISSAAPMLTSSPPSSRPASMF